MAIPVYLQQFKAAGIYRVVYDRSTVKGIDSEILRLVVGYSEKGPFNIPTYVSSVSDFKAIYGDISKKLEKRGVFFHRTALHALASGPILCLNLKKFAGETVDGSTINTDFNPNYAPIATVKLNVEDIYNTTRFWEIDAEKLNNLRATDGTMMDQYINICTTNTKDCSATYFIRKAAGIKVNGYNLTIHDWYSDKAEEMPEYLKPYANSLVSDFFAEVVVFDGRFTPAQVLASSTLKNYFEMATDENGRIKRDENGNEILRLRKHITNAYGEYTDTLDALYADETSGAIGRYIGCLIPYFKNKSGQYVALDIIFNADNGTHNMMMSFNTDMLEDESIANIDLSGRLSIPVTEKIMSGNVIENGLSLEELFNGTATTTLLGNEDASVITDTLTFTNNVVKLNDEGKYIAVFPLTHSAKKVMGTLYVNEIVADTNAESYYIKLLQVSEEENLEAVEIKCASKAEVYQTAVKLGAADVVNENTEGAIEAEGAYYKVKNNGYGTVWTSATHAFINGDNFTFEGPQQVITSIARIERTSAAETMYDDSDMNMKVSIENVVFSTISTYYKDGNPTSETDAVYGSSISFMPFDNNNWRDTVYEGTSALVNDRAIYDSSIFSVISVGDCFLADDGSTDRDNDGEDDAEDFFYDNVYVQSLDTVTNEDGTVTYVIKFSGTPLIWTNGGQDYLIRVDGALNREIGQMIPRYLEGYTYKNAKPASTGMQAKLDWQHFILSALTEYKGMRTALLNKSDIDYRYIVDTFESYVESDCKNILSFLAKEKQSAFAICNFPSVKTFLKCPYVSFTNNKGVFDVDFVVKGYNKKKAATTKFSLPIENDGASFCAFYTPAKFSDGYVDTVVPSAGLISNLFMEKYKSRQPYYIVAGPNYGLLQASGLVGPDYTYSQDELNIIEPFGVNCLVYRPGFGTFINANQTAKQTPVSALSKVNVRELVIYIQDEIEKVLQAYQWEFNNQTTRRAILDKANMICARVASAGGIQAFKNVMDESNNTPEIIDNEMAILDTHIEPGMGCGKMVQTLTLYKTGQMSVMISD